MRKSLSFQKVADVTWSLELSKKTYTEEEIQSLLEDLSLQKQRVYDLEQARPSLDQDEESNASKLKNLLSLQQLVIKYENEQLEIQQKLELALQQLEHYDESFALLEEENSQLKQLQKAHAQKDKNGVEERLAVSHKHAEQLDRVIHFLRERLEEANLEAQQLKEDYQKSQEYIQEFSHEKEQFKILLSEEQQTKAEALEEVSALRDQFSTLKNRVLEAEKQAQQIQTLHSENVQKNRLENELNQSFQQNLRELKEKENLLQEALTEKNHAVQRAHQIQQDLDKHKDLARTLREEVAEIHRVKTELEANYQKEMQCSLQLKAQRKEIDAKLIQLQEELVELQSHVDQATLAHLAVKSQLELSQELLKEKNIQFENVQQLVETQANEKQRDKELLTLAQAHMQELEAGLQTAELHLAKKVKEISLCQERYEEQKLNLHEMEKIHLHYEEKIVELQQKVDSHKEVESHLEEQAKKWEQQYHQMHEKWQKAETRNDELKAIEMKHNQMQTILKNMEALIGSPLLPPSVTEKNIPLSFSHESQETVQPSLFDLKDHTFSKHRDTFFD
ncbi:putative uncharacterized protein [Parachlamydia acanthamoebae UV-7]|uniref:Uncharacterized protein n=1 Tax=Parachlamydia acanthamoebae (strain UV7) TaxID=765952 RepID=F8KXM7_PARAV|nr:hypothetical protein [Parachlamydia acanthamoebae]CCB87494.1 putative uncharacterized protein [Parachlamydia acanthamoebae UV-7]